MSEICTHVVPVVTGLVWACHDRKARPQQPLLAPAALGGKAQVQGLQHGECLENQETGVAAHLCR